MSVIKKYKKILFFYNDKLGKENELNDRKNRIWLYFQNKSIFKKERKMSDYKLDGDYLKDRRGIKIGRIDGKHIRDGKGSMVGRIDGKHIRDSHGIKIADFDGIDIRDKRGVKIGTIDDVHKSINGVGGISLVALWILFVR